ncbi:hypothetical protein SKAU_G00373320 [Synaphobranchus kaupii]|uniref:Uncharacterized protein n=1 Tax=Synaphobranchus kaupii TaxID=118154 RepID=A0A9Q1EGE3_SYNKA|nr:hypothetical protein SKAU_G00373320 [Synaphobranchus kaupii]
MLVTTCQAIGTRPEASNDRLLGKEARRMCQAQCWDESERAERNEVDSLQNQTVATASLVLSFWVWNRPGVMSCQELPPRSEKKSSCARIRPGAEGKAVSHVEIRLYSNLLQVQ